MTVIREMKREDVVPLAKLMARYWSETIYAKAGLKRDWEHGLFVLNQIIDLDEAVGLVCDRDGEIVGVAFLLFERSWFDGLQCLIENFMIVPDERHKGLGVRLRNECLKIAKSRNVNLIRTSAESGFDDAGLNNHVFQQLWERSDFVPLGRIMVGFPQLDEGA